MGEARRRGSFEKRKRESIARKKAEAKKIAEKLALEEKQPGLYVRRGPRRKNRVLLTTLCALAASSGSL